ncbi:MAG TPA: acetyl-CoA acetyltransferase, partial [Caulobacter sp.]|nr:acetyl-CoA acetyltransferase [Caulobacter sp.]
MGVEMRDDTPVLIGAGQFTYRGEAANSPSPLELLKVAAERAVLDAGLKGSVLADLDALAVVAFSIDAPGGLSKLPLPRLSDPPASLARAFSATPSWSVYTETGGNSPQQAVNIVCERIAQGESQLALISGAEFLGSLMKRMKGGFGFEGWGDDLDSTPRRIGDPRPGVTEQEAAHGLGYPVNTYPLFENALRARDGRSIVDHQKALGELFAPFTKVAAANPYAWFPVERSAEELVTVT